MKKFFMILMATSLVSGPAFAETRPKETERQKQEAQKIDEYKKSFETKLETAVNADDMLPLISILDEIFVKQEEKLEGEKTVLVGENKLLKARALAQALGAEKLKTALSSDAVKKSLTAMQSRYRTEISAFDRKYKVTRFEDGFLQYPNPQQSLGNEHMGEATLLVEWVNAYQLLVHVAAQGTSDGFSPRRVTDAAAGIVGDERHSPGINRSAPPESLKAHSGGISLSKEDIERAKEKASERPKTDKKKDE